MCYLQKNTIKHTVVGCTTLAPSEFTDTIMLLVTSTGRYENIWGYRLLTGTKNTYLKGYKYRRCHYYVGRAGYH